MVKHNERPGVVEFILDPGLGRQRSFAMKKSSISELKVAETVMGPGKSAVGRDRG